MTSEAEYKRRLELRIGERRQLTQVQEGLVKMIADWEQPWMEVAHDYWSNVIHGSAYNLCCQNTQNHSLHFMRYADQPSGREVIRFQWICAEHGPAYDFGVPLRLFAHLLQT